jgi:peptidoglycan/LPS O-acetylase OafA/YrhL
MLESPTRDRFPAMHDGKSLFTPVSYLPFVDGLRALSILAVVGFHVGMPGFSGGFVGVDIFFVISGFLIISQIAFEIEAGRFAILTFYSRRALRILPVFLIVLLFVALLAPVILPTPDVFLDHLWASLSAPLMLSNVLFLLRQGYFDIAADQKPLLHTWTLSVEEQFYLLAPLLLLLAFWVGGRRFGRWAGILAIAIAVASLAGCIAYTNINGRNSAFYLAHWRAWEFVFGGLVACMVPFVRQLPRPIIELAGVLAIAAMVTAIVSYHERLPYPSGYAVLPVAGATLMITTGLAQPRIIAARMLALPLLVGIGVVSYGWYLWHWPILSFVRILRFGERSLVVDLVAGGLVALVLAILSYRLVERPIQKWRRSGEVPRPGRVVAFGVAGCLAVMVASGAIAVSGYAVNKSFVAERYGIEGDGVLDNGCRILTLSVLPDHCRVGSVGMLLGDSHADALSGSFARSFDRQGIRLVSIARGGCNPILFAPSKRAAYRQHGCANLLGPFEQLLALPPSFVIISSAWADQSLLTPEQLTELVAQFDPRQTRVLVIGPVPIFPASSLDCVVLSDRWYGGDRSRCGKARSEVDAGRAAIVKVLGTLPAGVRYVDPIDLFCDAKICEPFRGNRVFFRDTGHVSPAGAQEIYNRFESDFRWLAGGF